LEVGAEVVVGGMGVITGGRGCPDLPKIWTDPRIFYIAFDE